MEATVNCITRTTSLVLLLPFCLPYSLSLSLIAQCWPEIIWPVSCRSVPSLAVCILPELILWMAASQSDPQRIHNCGCLNVDAHFYFYFFFFFRCYLFTTHVVVIIRLSLYPLIFTYCLTCCFYCCLFALLSRSQESCHPLSLLVFPARPHQKNNRWERRLSSLLHGVTLAFLFIAVRLLMMDTGWRAPLEFLPRAPDRL